MLIRCLSDGRQAQASHTHCVIYKSEGKQVSSSLLNLNSDKFILNILKTKGDSLSLDRFLAFRSNCSGCVLRDSRTESSVCHSTSFPDAADPFCLKNSKNFNLNKVSIENELFQLEVLEIVSFPIRVSMVIVLTRPPIGSLAKNALQADFGICILI